MTRAPYGYRLFVRGDAGAFWALLTDNLVNMMVPSAVRQLAFGMPPEIVHGRIAPGVAAAVPAGVTVRTWLAERAAERQVRDVTALPCGISTPVPLVHPFGVIGPIH